MHKKITHFTSALGLLLASTTYAYAADLIDTAIASGSFNTFIAAVQASGLTGALKNQGPYTVFAPTDEAFAKLPDSTLHALLKDKAKLAQILSHHIIPGKILVSEVKPGSTKTVGGDIAELTSDNGKVMIDNAKVIESDLVADNGVIQAVDTVLIPK